MTSTSLNTSAEKPDSSLVTPFQSEGLHGGEPATPETHPNPRGTERVLARTDETVPERLDGWWKQWPITGQCLHSTHDADFVGSALHRALGQTGCCRV